MPPQIQILLNDIKTQLMQRLMHQFGSKMARSYEEAISILESRRRESRPSVNSVDVPLTGATHTKLPQMPSADWIATLKGRSNLAGMAAWLHILGHSDADIDALNVIHVAGSKGKGSTCAFTESLLRAHGNRTGFPRKIGLYTSPHLIHLEERVRINFEPLSRDLFAKYFFEVLDGLSRAHKDSSQSEPRYLQLMGLLSFHTFIREGVDVAIYETHHGGEYDVTNIIKTPVVTAITTLGMDHVKQLGPTIENIAWHKAGIFKAGAAALSAPQEKAAAQVLRNRAVEKGVDLKFTKIDPELPAGLSHLQPEVQRINCSLSLEVVRSFLKQTAPKDRQILSPADVSLGIAEFAWPGRFQVVDHGKNQWFLDAAHNEMSVGEAADWFGVVGQEMRRGLTLDPLLVTILIFSHISDARDGMMVLERLAKALSRIDIPIDHVTFTTYRQELGSIGQDGSVSVNERAEFDVMVKEYSKVWRKTHPQSVISEEFTIEEALNRAKSIGQGKDKAQTLITGSQYLVGGALRLLEANAANTT